MGVAPHLLALRKSIFGSKVLSFSLLRPWGVAQLFESPWVGWHLHHGPAYYFDSIIIRLMCHGQFFIYTVVINDAPLISFYL